MAHRIVALLMFSGMYFAASAQSDTSDYSKTNRYAHLFYENDFFSATDRYYTQGISGDFIAPIIRYSPVSYLLFRLNKRSQHYYGIAFEQDCFTPRSIRYDTLNTTERPYGANMYLSHFLTSIDPVKKRRLTTRLDLGIVGPCARCEDEQKAIHKALKNIRPLGWEYQIGSGYMV
ncbi:MAG: lipid A-modifier LpxR family protein, partial [Bacteroidia bacterium]